MNTPQTTALTIDFWPLIQCLLGLAGTAVSGVATWALNHWIAKLKAEKLLVDQKQEDGLRAIAEKVVQGGLGYADEIARQYGRPRATVQVRNEMAGVALNYALAAAPDTLKQLGLTPEAVFRMILSRMPTPADDAPDPMQPRVIPTPAPAVTAPPPPPPVTVPLNPFNPWAGGIQQITAGTPPV